jgi:hypothetical protein
MIKQMFMKTTVLFLSLLLSMVCSAQTTQQEKTTEKQVEINSNNPDSTEYELIVSEVGFESYLISQLPMEFYSETYYKNWNTMYAIEYNSRFISGPRQEIYENEINYNPSNNYGIEIEYKLYYYFRFFEKKYGVTLINRGR